MKGDIFMLKEIETANKRIKFVNKFCKEHNINLVEVWESDYNKDSEGVKKLLAENIA